jgi:hypothetical protein
MSESSNSTSGNEAKTALASDANIRLVYHSTSAIPDYPEVVGLALDDILEAARNRNVQCGCSGALIYADRQFLQVLEGPVAAVDETLERIMQDKRHTNVRLIARVPAQELLFERWPMAFLSEPELRPMLKQVGLNGTFDISRMPVDLIGPFLSSVLAPVVQAARSERLPAHLPAMLAQAI